jgi:peptidoglycan/xylan/chitin deacetylase (PgdA/CDA1 family)
MNSISLLFHDVFAQDAAESGFSSAAADRYKLPIADFDAQIASLRAARRGSDDVRLTFDDGGVSYYTLVAGRLEEAGLRGYCFVTSGFIGARGFLSIEQIRDLDSRGHIIGTHSVSHPPRFSALAPAEMRREWSESRCAIEDVVGHAISAASVPGGYFSRAVAETAAESGIHLLFNSEPVTSTYDVNGCEVAGRFTIRRGAAPDLSRRLVSRAPSARCAEWASWNAKGLVKPLLGSFYPQVADWIHGG